MPHRQLVLLCCFSILLGGCAALQQPRCNEGEKAVVQESLYFGTAKPVGGVVTQQEWSEFLSEVVTPRFPAGFSTWPVSGQWRSETGEIVREDSYVLRLVYAPDDAAAQKVKAVVDQYSSQFQQEAVLRVRTDACMSLNLRK